MKPRVRMVLLALAGVAVSGAALVGAFWRLRVAGGALVLEPRVHLHDIVAALRGAHRGWLALFALVNVTTLVVRAFQLRASARRRDGSAPRLWRCYQAVAVGMMAHNLVPARLSEAARVVALTRADDVSLAASTGAAVFGRVLDLAALLIVTCVPSLLLRLPAASTRGLTVLAELGSLAALGLVIAMIVFYRRRARVAARAERLRPWLGKLVHEFADGLSALDDRRRMLTAIASSLAIPATLALAYGAALYAFDLGGLPRGTTLVLVAAILFAIAIPSAPSSVGVFHAVATWLLVALGAPPPAAAAFALVTHAIGVVTFVVLGGIALAQLGGGLLRPTVTARSDA